MASFEESSLSVGSLLCDVLEKKPNFIEKLALCLDRNMRLIPNWKHLSRELKVHPEVISSLEQYSDFSPTIRLFEYLEVTQPDLTIKQLKQALSDIRRNDLLHLLITKGCTDSKLVKDVITARDVLPPSPLVGLLDEIALALDKQSKILKHWGGLAERLGVPSETLKQFQRRSAASPTIRLFEHLAVTRPKMTLKTLKKALVTMTRSDLINILRDKNLADEVQLTDAIPPGSDLLQTMACKLDIEQVPWVQNWRQLAHHLEIPPGVYQDFDGTEPRKSPTKEVLQWLAVRSPNVTLIDVVKALEVIQRNDAIQIIKEQFPDIVDFSLEHLRPSLNMNWNFDLRNDAAGEEFFTTSYRKEECNSYSKEEVAKKPGHCGSLPDSPYNLKGRKDECEHIINSLISKKAVEVVAPPGYGKTSVVVQVAHTMIRQHEKFVAYLNPRGVYCVEDLGSEIIEALGGTPGENTIKESLRCLRSLKANNVVLIIDNLDTLLHLEQNRVESSIHPDMEWCSKIRGRYKKDDFLTFIKDIGQTGRIHLVLTSTETNDFSVSFQTELVELKPLNDDHSSALFKERDSGLDEDTIKKLVNICGGIPLIIFTLLSLLKKRNPQNFARRLSNCTPLELITELSPEFLPPEDRIHQCLKLCFHRLSQENQEVLVMLSTFPHRFTQFQFQAVFQSLTNLDLERCVNSLKQSSLLRFERESCHFCINRIIRTFCSTQPTHKEAKSYFIRHYSDLVVTLSERFFSVDSKTAIEQYRLEKENFREATAWCENGHLELDQELREYCIDAFSKAAVFLAKVMRKQEFKSLFCKLCSQSRDDLRRSSCLTAVGTKIVLSCTCSPQICSRAWLRAKSVLLKANEIQLGLKTVDEATRAHCLSKLGFCFVREGLYDEGFGYLDQAIKLRTKLREQTNKAEDKVMLAACFNDVAASVMLQRKHMAALQIRKTLVLPVYKANLGSHPFLATTLGWIAKSYHELGDYDNAIEFATQALEIRKSTLGRHQETARSHYDLGDSLSAKEDFSRALEHLKHAAEIQEEVLDTHEELILTHQAMAVVLKQLGQDEEAEREMEQAGECAKNLDTLDVPLGSWQTDPVPINTRK